MKKAIFFSPFEIIPYLIFLTGIAFVTYHLAYGDIILLSTAPFCFAITLLRNLFHRDKTFLLPKILVGLSISVWLLYFSFRILFLEHADIIFYTAIATSVIAIIFSINKKQLIIIQKVFLVLHIAVGILLKIYPNSNLYYTLVLGAGAKETPEEYPYGAWDSYSWYLYNDQHYDEALDANALATISAKAVFKTQQVDSSIFEQLESNKIRIENRNWNEFIPFEEVIIFPKPISQ